MHVALWDRLAGNTSFDQLLSLDCHMVMYCGTQRFCVCTQCCMHRSGVMGFCPVGFFTWFFVSNKLFWACCTFFSSCITLSNMKKKLDLCYYFTNEIVCMYCNIMIASLISSHFYLICCYSFIFRARKKPNRLLYWKNIPFDYMLLTTISFIIITSTALNFIDYFLLL